jgi:glutamate N-acetyltransferase/amino-acid N-acetyltransferase
MSRAKRFKTIPGSICAPRGFKAAAVFCDIKKLGTGKGSEKGRKNDLALIISDVPATVAGMFTTNRVCAPPVKVSAKCAARKTARAIVVNSGNANACTGRPGLRDAERMARITSESVAAVYSSRCSTAKADDRRNSLNSAVADRRYRSIKPNDVLVCSTGRIGIPMPMKNVERGIRACAPLLAQSDRNARNVAEAIMTSDTRRKEIAVEIEIDGKAVRIGGICKGAGMIQPCMAVATALRRRGGTPRPASAALRRGKRSGAATAHATMLCFITTDVVISPLALRQFLIEAVEQSFNRITVDGDMSTNDSVIALANGLAGNRRLDRVSPHRQRFQKALNFVALELAKMIVRDGEGVSRFVTVRMHNAKNARDAERAARAITTSSLVRTSWCGGDPNWGRILSAIGYSGAMMNEAATDIGYSLAGRRRILYGFRQGRPTNVSLRALARLTAAPEFDVHVNLHQGKGEFTIYASDLTEEYVAFNKGDVNDPATLGG